MQPRPGAAGPPPSLHTPPHSDPPPTPPFIRCTRAQVLGPARLSRRAGAQAGGLPTGGAAGGAGRGAVGARDAQRRVSGAVGGARRCVLACAVHPAAAQAGGGLGSLAPLASRSPPPPSPPHPGASWQRWSTRCAPPPWTPSLFDPGGGCRLARRAYTSMTTACCRAMLLLLLEVLPDLLLPLLLCCVRCVSWHCPRPAAAATLLRRAPPPPPPAGANATWAGGVAGSCGRLARGGASSYRRELQDLRRGE